MSSIVAEVTYPQASSARADSQQPSIDRARGGIIKIKLTIPQETIKAPATIGSAIVDIPKKEVTITIDLEKMPLIDTSAYKVEETQTGPDSMDYPDGPGELSFTFKK